MTLSINGLRALNEYRRDSLLTYLSLRYTLEAKSARGVRWADEIAPDIAFRTPRAAYLRQQQFKECNGARFEYRRMHFPGGNEALAEASLLSACQKVGGAFKPRRGVYSYHLAPPEYLDGFFCRFMDLFRKRQAAIARRCKRYPNHVVLYADIRRFYPSVSRRRALVAWRKACVESGLEERWTLLGEHLLEKQAQVEAKGLLVGPRLSHLLADLVLRDIDKEMRRLCGLAYYRYVDDFAVVVPSDQVSSTKKQLRSRLKKIGLTLHPKKFYSLRAGDWKNYALEQAELELETERSKKWMGFVDRLKGFLVTRPRQHEELRQRLLVDGFRLPLPRYRNQVSETRYVGRFASRLKRPWFLRRTSRASISGILHTARQLRRYYLDEFGAAIADFDRHEGIRKKWALTRVRFALGKLTMLAGPTDIPSIRSRISGKAAFVSHDAIFRAVETTDVSQLLKLGAPTCAAAGELLTGTDTRFRCAPDRWSQPAIDGYTTLILQGVSMTPQPPPHVRQRRIVRLVHGRCALSDWLRMEPPFLRELAALSAGASVERHRDLVSTPLDPGEPLSSVDFTDPLGS